jgi:hypothetical protein
MRQFIRIERCSRREDPDGPERNSLTAAHFANYQDYNKTLRTWFVTFGIGALTLFLLHPESVRPLKAAGSLGPVIKLYLVGCGAQILIALINKFAGWHAYSGALDAEHGARWSYRAWEWLFAQFWLDMVADVASVIAFGAATYLMFQALVQ